MHFGGEPGDLWLQSLSRGMLIRYCRIHALPQGVTGSVHELGFQPRDLQVERPLSAPLHVCETVFVFVYQENPDPVTDFNVKRFCFH